MTTYEEAREILRLTRELAEREIRERERRDIDEMILEGGYIRSDVQVREGRWAEIRLLVGMVLDRDILD